MEEETDREVWHCRVPVGAVVERLVADPVEGVGREGEVLGEVRVGHNDAEARVGLAPHMEKTSLRYCQSGLPLAL